MRKSVILYFIKTLTLWEIFKILVSFIFLYIVFSKDAVESNESLIIIGNIIAFTYFVLYFFDLYSEIVLRPFFQKSPLERRSPVLYVLINMSISFAISTLGSLLTNLMLFGKLEYVIFFVIIIRTVYEMILRIQLFKYLS
jgi:hypothetical protein